METEKHRKIPMRVEPDGKVERHPELPGVSEDHGHDEPISAVAPGADCVPAAEKDAGEKGAQEPPAAEMDNRKVIEELREQIRRMQADFENFKRRMEQSREDMRACAREDVLKSLLPVIDNLEWALHSTKQSKNFDAFFEGITLVARSFKELLTREGLVEITAAGERFDPSRHQAIAMEEREDMPDETVVEEFQKGYQLGTKVIRPSLVKVARVPHKEEAKSDE